MIAASFFTQNNVIADDFPLQIERPVIRVFKDSNKNLPLDVGQLRNIDGAASEFEINTISSSTNRNFTDQTEDNRNEPPSYQPRSITQLFQGNRFFSWLFSHPNQSTEPAIQPLFSTRNDTSEYNALFIPRGNNAIIQPVGLSLPSILQTIPNPIAMLSNPAHWGGKLRADYAPRRDGRAQISGNLIVVSGSPFGFDTEFVRREDRPRTPNGRTHKFWTGDFNIIGQFGRVRNVQFRTGFGVNWSDDNGIREYGFNSTIGVDFLVYQRWVIATSFDWGTLGSEQLKHARITGGINLGRLEVYAGYDFHEIGDQERKGLIAGVGLLF